MASIVEKSVPFALLFFGCGVLVTSLLAANRVSTGDRTRLLSRKVYFSKTILPDNVFYPVVMVGDRIKLETAGHEQKIVLRVEYYERRYTSAQQLLAKDQDMLALTTISKAQKYLFVAGNDVLADPTRVSPQTISIITEKYAQAYNRLLEMKQIYSGQDAQIIDELTQETQIIYQKLNTLGAQQKP